MRRVVEAIAAQMNKLGIKPGDECRCPGYFEKNGMPCISYGPLNELGGKGEVICRNCDGWVCHSRSHIEFMYIDWDGTKWIVLSLTEKKPTNRKLFQ